MSASVADATAASSSIAAAASSPGAGTALATVPPSGIDRVREIDSHLRALQNGEVSPAAWSAAERAIRALQDHLRVRPNSSATADELFSEQALAAEAAHTTTFLASLPFATRASLLDTLLLYCFMPPSRDAPPSSKRFRESDRCREASIAMVRACASPLMADMAGSAVVSHTLTTLALCLGTVTMESAPVTLGANTAHHERGSRDVTPLGENSLIEQLQASGQYQQQRTPQSDTSNAIWAEREKVAEKTFARSEQHMRSQYLSLLRALLLYDTHRQLVPHIPVIASMLYVSLSGVSSSSKGEDAGIFHSCDVLYRLATTEEYRGIMRVFSRPLLVVLMPRLLRHRHSRVRLEGLRVLRVMLLSLHGSSELLRDLAGFREGNLIEFAAVYDPSKGVRANYMGMLVADSNVAVREEFARTVQSWSLELHDRADYDTLLWPYVLSGLSDPSALVRNVALETLDRAAQAYEVEERQRLASGVGGNALDEQAFRNKLAAEEAARAHITQAHPMLLFEPFDQAGGGGGGAAQRPRWGARQLGAKYFPRLLHAVLTEAQDWKPEVAAQSWGLMRVLLMLVEEHATGEVEQITAAIVQATTAAAAATAAQGGGPTMFAREGHSNNNRQEQIVRDCAALVGRYMHPKPLLNALVAQVRRAASSTGSSNASSARLVAALDVAAFMLPYIPPVTLPPQRKYALTPEAMGVDPHVVRERALEVFVEAVLGEEEEEAAAYLAHETAVFEAYVRTVAAIVALPALSHTWKQKHAPSLFRKLLEIAGWSRRKHFTAGSVAPPTLASSSASATAAAAAASAGSSSSTSSSSPAVFIPSSIPAAALEQHQRLQTLIDSSYVALLQQQYGEDEEDLVVLMQLRLPSIVAQWDRQLQQQQQAQQPSDLAAASPSPGAWDERTLEFCMLVEVLDRAAAAAKTNSDAESLFVALKDPAVATASPSTPVAANATNSAVDPVHAQLSSLAASEQGSDSRVVSLLLQSTLIHLLNRPTGLTQAMSAALLPPLADCIAAANCRCSTALLFAVAASLLRDLPAHVRTFAHQAAVHAAATSAASSSWKLLPFDERKRAEAAARVHSARVRMFGEYVAGARYMAAALKDKLAAAHWCPTDEQRQALREPLPTQLPQLHLPAADGSSTAAADVASLLAWREWSESPSPAQVDCDCVA